MRNLEKVIARIETELDEKDEVREVALKSSRAVVRLAGAVLRELHRDEDFEGDYTTLKDEVSRLSGLLEEHPDIASTGYVEAAYQEYAEVGIILSLLGKNDVPTPEELGTGSVPYLLGLADAVGELRRFCLDELKAGDVGRANLFLEQMEELFAAIIRFDYPEAILPVRRKQDIARSMLEKTRGEVAIATSTSRLQDKLEEVLRRK